MSYDKKNPNNQQPDVKEIVKDVLNETLPAAMMAAAQMNAQTMAKMLGVDPDREKRLEEEQRRKMAARVQCEVCGQPVGACGGWGPERDKDGKELSREQRAAQNHVKMYVGPKNTRRLKAFPGIFLNGVQYISSRPGQLIWVPKGTDFPRVIDEWERSEEEMVTGRKVEHNSGIITPNNQSGFREYRGAGFRQ